MITSVWMLFDINSRFLRADSVVQNRQEHDQYSAMVLHVTSDARLKEINQRYDVFRVVDNESSEQVSKTMTEQQQALQNGELTEFYVGKQTLTLKAVVNIERDNLQTATVLLAVLNNEDNSQTIEVFSPESTVYGYSLTILSNTQVALVKQLQENTQRVVLTMYQPEI